MSYPTALPFEKYGVVLADRFETLRKHLADEDLTMVNGAISLPTRPGLGVDVDYAALKRFTVA